MDMKMIELVGHQSVKIATDHDEEITFLMEHGTDGYRETDDNPRLMAYKVFILGYLAGIRAEREKKKTHIASWKLTRSKQKGRC